MAKLNDLTTGYDGMVVNIKAKDIEAWVERNNKARTQLAVLLRHLVHSNEIGIIKIDFPGNDNAEQPGWDGYIETTQCTPWVPDGVSGWEFGTNKEINDKANKDFIKNVDATRSIERNQMTFVFVTPRYWPGKANWINKKKTEKQWKDVRA